jgi:hypothetical protein
MPLQVQPLLAQTMTPIRPLLADNWEVNRQRPTRFTRWRNNIVAYTCRPFTYSPDGQLAAERYLEEP